MSLKKYSVILQPVIDELVENMSKMTPGHLNKYEMVVRHILSLAHLGLEEELVPPMFVKEYSSLIDPLLAMAMSYASPDGFFVKQQGRYVWTNEQMGPLIGVSEDEFLGSTDDQIYDEKTAKRLEEMHGKASQGKPILHQYNRVVNGKTKIFREVLLPLKTGTGIWGIVRDVTDFYYHDIDERKRRDKEEEERRRQEREQEEKEQEERERERRQESALWRKYPIPETCRSSTMQQTVKRCFNAAASDSTVVLTGESGSGKGFLADYIHKNSLRSTGPFMKLDCAELSPELIEGEIFGWEKNAHAMAHRAKKGLLEKADGGTLFLDEIGELPLRLQGKFLKFLQEKKSRRLGALDERVVDTRIIAATNRNLAEEVANRTFRADLFYRLNVFSIEVPPLRTRKQDIAALIKGMVPSLGTKLGNLDSFRDNAHFLLSAASMPNSELMKIFSSYEWPGNVRELENIVQTIIIEGLQAAQSLNSVEIPESAKKVQEPSVKATDTMKQAGAWRWETEFPSDKSFKDLVEELRISIGEEALRRTGGKKQPAARLLGVRRDFFYRANNSSPTRVGKTRNSK